MSIPDASIINIFGKDYSVLIVKQTVGERVGTTT